MYGLFKIQTSIFPFIGKTVHFCDQICQSDRLLSRQRSSLTIILINKLAKVCVDTMNTSSLMAKH